MSVRQHKNIAQARIKNHFSSTRGSQINFIENIPRPNKNVILRDAKLKRDIFDGIKPIKLKRN